MRVWLPALVGAIALLAAAGGWAVDQGTDDPPALAIASPSTTAAPEPAVRRSPRRSAARRFPSRADRASFRRLASSLGGSHGVAVAAVGHGSRVVAFGARRPGVAWSTIKPVVAMAVLSSGIDDAAVRADMDLAITRSDNAAAERLWQRLGDDATAAAATQTQLVELGDGATLVPTRRQREGFTVFGQTQWPLAEQVRAVAAMPCSAEGQRVLRVMRGIEPNQRWGLGSLGEPAAFKGGWGPDPAGGYLVRQTGVVDLGGREIAVALASRPADGSFASGIRAVDALARWVSERAVGRVPANGCGS